MQCFSAGDRKRALRTLGKLGRHGIVHWALAGGLAVEFHSLRSGHPPAIRRLNDIDFVAPSFDCIPETLAGDFLFRHIHPLDPPGKTMLQLVDAGASLRVDLFRTNASIMSRALAAEFPFGSLPVVSLEDVVARAARLLLDLGAGVPVAAKHARDYLRLAGLAEPSLAEIAWRDHRRPAHPMTFRETGALVRSWMETRPGLLIDPVYSTDTGEVCPRCVETAAFRLADPELVLSLLGYC
jgi:hypothetical protein